MQIWTRDLPVHFLPVPDLGFLGRVPPFLATARSRPPRRALFFSEQPPLSWPRVRTFPEFRPQAFGALPPLFALSTRLGAALSAGAVSFLAKAARLFPPLFILSPATAISSAGIGESDRQRCSSLSSFPIRGSRTILLLGQGTPLARLKKGPCCTPLLFFFCC